MIKFEFIEVHGFAPALRGMRNPMESWDRSDSMLDHGRFHSCFCDCSVCEYFGTKENPCPQHYIGQNDLNLAKKLCRAGSDHRKFMRMVDVWVDITAPLYWWKEFDTYKVGTVANSCSTMHKIHAREFTMDDFSHEHLSEDASVSLKYLVQRLNWARQAYLATNNKQYWYDLIQLLPTSYNQRRTVKLNYEVLTNIYHARRSHKLTEWRDFCAWIETLPYHELITGGETNPCTTST